MRKIEFEKTEIRCACGKLIAIVRNEKVYVKCKGCKHEVEIPMQAVLK